MLNKERAALLQWMLSDECYFSPYRFVMTAYPWGEDDLREFKGPRSWQKEIMLEMEQYLRDAAKQKKDTRTLPDFFRYATASGRGPGKSAFLGMLAHWFISTRIGGSTWVAANGEPQLRTKTFPEISKWVARGINSDFFDLNAMSVTPSTWFKNYIESPQGLGRSTRYYYISGQLWSEESPDAFAGAHNMDGEMALFDEASGIPDAIWTVQEGVFTENIPDRFWMAFSNPRRPDGAFFECFNRNRDRWRTRQIDSRTVEGISQTPFENIIDQYGPESNEAKIEVYGQFPSIGDSQFIDADIVDAALARERYNDTTAPRILGVDVARFGADKTCMTLRQGRDLVAVKKFSGLDTMQVVGRVIELIDKYQPDLTVIDEGGLGAGVVDRLLEQRFKVRGVNFGSKADASTWGNRRSEMWGALRDWLKTASIGSEESNAQRDNRELKDDLIGPQYKLDSNGRTLLESKADMKKRGMASPDAADAVAVTFAYPVAARKSTKPLREKMLAKQNRGMLQRSADGAWMT